MGKTKEMLQAEFEEALKPLMKYLSENYNPHCTVIVNSTSAELVEGKFCFNSNEFLKD